MCKSNIDNKKETIETKSAEPKDTLNPINRSDDIIRLLIQDYQRIMSNVERINVRFLGNSSFYILGVFMAIGYIAQHSNNSFLKTILPIILPFLLLYYAYNTLKYTLHVMEYRGHAYVIEKRINNLLKENILVENQAIIFSKSKNLKTALISRAVYGGILQIAFIVPISCFIGIGFRNALIKAYLPETTKIIVFGALVVSFLAIVYLVILMLLKTNKSIELYGDLLKTED